MSLRPHTIALRLSDSELAAFKRYAERRGLSVAGMIRSLVAEQFKPRPRLIQLYTEAESSRVDGEYRTLVEATGTTAPDGSELRSNGSLLAYCERAGWYFTPAGMARLEEEANAK